jgi:peptide/nickel transport system substrate-binding protein
MAALVLVVAGLTASYGGTTSATAGGSSATGGGSNSSKTLIIAAAATPTTLDPEFSSSAQDRESDVSVYDRFTQFQTKVVNGVKQADLSKPPVPLLAKKWKVSKDGRTYTFTLRKGVKSFAGNEMTSADVVWSWDRVFAQQSQGLFPLNVSSVEKGSYKAVGKYEVQVRLPTPNPLLPIVLATPVPGAVIYDSTEVKKHATPDDKWGRKWLATHTASFGPYQAQSFTPGQQVVYVANPNYYGTKPAMSTVIYKEIPDSSNRLSLLESGQVDIAEDLDAQQRQSLKGASGVNIVNVPGNLAIAFGLNNKIAPFTDPRVRKAIAMATPVGDIIKSVYFGDPTVRLFKGYVADTFPAYPNWWPYQPPNLAKQLLAAAGQQHFSFQLSYTTTYPEHERIAEFIKTGLAKIGVTVNLNKLTPASFQQLYYGHKAQSVLLQDAAFVADSAYPLYLYFGRGKGAVGNWINYSNRKVQDKIDQALAEPDQQKRAAEGEAADRAIVNDAPWAMYLGIGFHMSERSSISGYVWRPHNLLEFADLKKG